MNATGQAEPSLEGSVLSLPLPAVPATALGRGVQLKSGMDGVAGVPTCPRARYSQCDGVFPVRPERTATGQSAARSPDESEHITGGTPPGPYRV